MLDIGTTFLGAYLVSYAIAVVMPTWRWLLALTLVAAVTLYAGWLRDWIALLLPNAEGPGTAIGGALALVVTIGFSTGVLVRGTTIMLALCGLGSGYVVVICVAGIAIAPAILAFAPKLVSLFRFRFEGGGVRQRSSSLRSMRPEKPLPFVAYAAASAPLRSPACNIQHRRVRRYPAVPALKPG
jgi:hypothetical protein